MKKPGLTKTKHLPNIKKSWVTMKEVAQKVDQGWTNILTNLGMTKDKRSGLQIASNILDRFTLEALYQADDIASKVIDRIPHEMLREGYKILVKDDQDDLSGKLAKEFDRFEINKKLEETMRWARLYGGGALFIGVKDGLKPDQPLDLSKVSEIDFVAVLDRWQLFPVVPVQSDISKPGYGLPEFYTLSNSPQMIQERIHYSRLIRFDGIELPRNLRAQNQYWGDSVLSRIYNPLKNFQSAHDSAATIIQDFTVGIFTMQNLMDLLAQGKDDLLTTRLELVSGLSSIVNSIVIQEGESFERKTTNVSGLPEMLNTISMRLVAASQMPHTLLLGESPSGLGATGNSEKIDWYDEIKNQQKSILEPAIKKIAEIFFSSKKGITKGVIPDFTMEFNSLWQMDEKEKIEIRKTQAETDQIYINSNVLDPEEVTNSRFGGLSYSMETTLNKDIRQAMENSTGDPPNDNATP